MSESMPYFAIAREHDVSYADVLAWVDYLEGSDPSEVGRSVLDRIGDDVGTFVVGALILERRRRRRVIAEDRAHEERKRADFEEASELPGCAEPDEPCHGPQDTTCPVCGLGLPKKPMGFDAS